MITLLQPFLLFKLIYTSTLHYIEEFICEYNKYCEDTTTCNSLDYHFFRNLCRYILKIYVVAIILQCKVLA